MSPQPRTRRADRGCGVGRHWLTAPRRWALAAVFVALAVGTPLGAWASQAPLPARLTADLPAAGSWHVGVFSPLRWAPREGLELELHPLVALVAPHATVRVAHRRGPGMRITGSYGLGLPTPALRIAPPGLAGYLGPSCKVRAAEPQRAPTSCEVSGHVLVVDAGWAATWGEAAPTTLRADGAYGVVVSGERARPFDAWPPLDLLLAPIGRGWRAHASVRHDRALRPWLRLAAEAHVWRLGRDANDSDDRSLWIVGGHLGGDLRLGPATRLTAGVLYTNADTRATAIETDADGLSRRVRVRSHDWWPTLDVIWAF